MSRKDNHVLFYIGVILTVFLTISAMQYRVKMDVHSNNPKNDILETPPQISLYEGMKSSSPILIQGNSEFTAKNGVKNPGASGTATDPFIIENWTIISGGSGIGIQVKNTNKHFMIKNCQIYNFKGSASSAGIYLENVRNAQISHNTCHGNEIGILLETSNNNLLEDNDCQMNGHGIVLQNCLDWNRMSNNECEENRLNGITLVNSKKANLEGNTCTQNGHSGISLQDSSTDNLLSSNTCSNNEENGVHLNSSDQNTLKANQFARNEVGINLINSHNNTIENNEFNFNAEMIKLSESRDNQVDFLESDANWVNFIASFIKEQFLSGHFLVLITVTIIILGIIGIIELLRKVEFKW